MKIFSLPSHKHEQNVPQEIYNWRVYFAAIVATFAAVMIGYDAAFIGTSLSLPSFKSEFGLDTKPTAELNLLSANIVSCYQAGAFFGAIGGYPLGYYWGRKWALVICAAVFCLGAILQCVSSTKTGLGVMYGGRVVVGLGIGVASNIAPIYVAEIAPATIRGRLIGLYELCWQIGGVIGFWINYGTNQNIAPSRKQWLVAFAIQLIPGSLLFIFSFFLPESPRWLLSRSLSQSTSSAASASQAAALRNLSFLRNLPTTHPYLQEEFSTIEQTLRKERDELLKSRSKMGSGEMALRGFFDPIRAVLFDPKLFGRLLLGSSLFAWQNATGINAINYYSPTIFKSMGITGTSTALLTTGVFGIIKLFGALIWLFYMVDSLGRRTLLMIGSLGGALSMYYIGAFIAIAKPLENGGNNLDAGGRSAVAFFYLWTIFYSPTWNGTPWVVGAEIFPQHVRTFTQACMGASNWLYGFLIARFTPQMFTAMGYGVYIFFASLMILSIFYVFFLLPETKQVPLEYMEDLFAPGLSAWRAHDIVMEHVADKGAQEVEAQEPSELRESNPVHTAKA